MIKDLDGCMAMNQTECKYQGVKDFKGTESYDKMMSWAPRRVEWTFPLFCDRDQCK